MALRIDKDKMLQMIDGCSVLFSSVSYKSFFSKLNNQISAFIWKKKPPQINTHQHTTENSREGRDGIPRLHVLLLSGWHKIATVLDEVNCYSPWMDNYGAASIGSTSLLCAKLPFTQPLSCLTSNSVVVHSIKIWTQFKRSFLLRDPSLTGPIANNLPVYPIIDG